MTRRPATLLAGLALAATALLTACGPGSSGGHAAPGPADSSQVQDMQHKLDAADSAATQADTDSAADNG
ncbi:MULTISPECIES: hypothetical protein [Streptomyces]|uniref:hypothetical protein n=1 Tax=Streptomyces TaxID=1883 RepID=UPI0004ABBEFE|nr:MULTISPECIES: hypothetical protein [Streptomyces]